MADDKGVTQRVIDEIRRSSLHKIKVAVTDIDGVLRGKYLHREKFLAAADSGFGLCNVVFGWDTSDACYDNSRYTGWHTGYPDALVKLDLATYRKIPWEASVPFFLGDFEDHNGAPLPLCPRQLLKKVIATAQEAGFRPKCGMEFEWFNFKETPQSLAEKGYLSPEPLTPGMFGYSILRTGAHPSYFSELMDQLEDFRIPLEGFHTETGPGVLEAAILFSDALEAADRATLFKTAVKEIAYRHDIMASFMAKWNVTLPGCSGHLHLSLWNELGDKNLFYNSTTPTKMNPLLTSFLAGQVACLPEILPFFAPNVNSYKRLVEGFWAPTRATWGLDNRTTAFRVIMGGAKSTRIEVRISGADVNPYLVIAASIASGLYGIKKGLELSDKPIVGSAYKEERGVPLSRNLLDATTRLSQSKIAHELFGDEFVDHFVATRLWEWRQFQDSVTNWELKRYFEII